MDRRRMMARQPRLPSGYQEVEWIGTTGNEYIDTNYVPTYGANVALSISQIRFPISGDYFAYFGCREDAVVASKTNFWLGINNGGTVYNRIGTVNISTSPSISLGDKHNIVVNNVTKQLIIDEESYSFSGSVISGIARKIFIGRLNGSGLPQSGSAIFYCAKIEDENGDIVRNYVPCYRKSDGVIGMYDLCGSICPLTVTPFYINSGTGTFTKGADVK